MRGGKRDMSHACMRTRIHTNMRTRTQEERGNERGNETAGFRVEGLGCREGESKTAGFPTLIQNQWEGNMSPFVTQGPSSMPPSVHDIGQLSADVHSPVFRISD
jgi:hypothetical protein